MDPEIPLADIVRHIRMINECVPMTDTQVAIRYGELAASAEALIEWLASGGFSPDWKAAIRAIDG